MAESKVGVEITATDSASSVISNVRNNLKSLQKNVQDLQPVFQGMQRYGAAAFAAIAGEGVLAVKAYSEAQQAMTVANVAVNNTLQQMSEGALKKLHVGMQAGLEDFEVMEQKLKDVGNAAVQLGYDDEDAAVAFAKLFQVTQDATQAQSDLALAMDLAAFSGRDLASSADAITKVHAGGTRVLKEFGIEVADGTTALEALSIVQTKVGGTAEAMTGNIATQTRILQIRIQNLQESIGAALIPVIQRLLDTVSPLIQRFGDWAEANPELLARLLLTAGAVALFVTAVGTLGVMLPIIIGGITMLLNPVALAIIAFTAIGAAVIAFHEQIAAFFKVLDEKTGLITFMKIQWDNVVLVFQQMLLPALADLWESLQPFMPFLKALATVIGAMLVGAVTLLTYGLEGLAILAATIITKWAQFVTWVNNTLMPIFSAIGDAVAYVVGKIEALIAAISRLNFLQGARNVINSVGSAIGGVLGINDGIVQNGRIITTHPDDYIIATKTPETLGGGGRNININISGAVLSREAAQTIGDMILGQLRLQMKV